MQFRTDAKGVVLNHTLSTQLEHTALSSVAVIGSVSQLLMEVICYAHQLSSFCSHVSCPATRQVVGTGARLVRIVRDLSISFHLRRPFNLFIAPILKETLARGDV